MNNTISKPFKGVFTALITPFLAQNKIDEDALFHLISMQIDNKVHGLVLAGSTGEASTLELEERVLLLKIAKKMLKEQKLIIGAGHNSTSMAIKMQKTLEDAGADATLQVVPYYNKPTPLGLLKHFLKIADNAKKPIILYNVPSRTGIDMPIEIILKLLSEHEKIIGIKESNQNLERLTALIGQIKATRPKAFVLSGEDGLFLPSLAIGADGIISIASNIIPKDFLDIYNFFNNNKILLAQETAYKIQKICNLMTSYSNPIPIKTILYKKGFIKNIFRMPLCPLNKKEENLLWKEFNKFSK